jgi:uncharacterized protein YuzE
MKVKYSRDVDILTVELSPSAQIVHAEHTNGMIIHFDPDDQPVLLEIFDAHRFVNAIVDAVMERDAAV